MTSRQNQRVMKYLKERSRIRRGDKKEKVLKKTAEEWRTECGGVLGTVTVMIRRWRMRSSLQQLTGGSPPFVSITCSLGSRPSLDWMYFIMSVSRACAQTPRCLSKHELPLFPVDLLSAQLTAHSSVIKWASPLRPDVLSLGISHPCCNV